MSDDDENDNSAISDQPTIVPAKKPRLASSSVLPAPTVVFATSTLNVKDFCNIISGFLCTSAENVLFRFSPEGLTMYALEMSILVTAFWNPMRFQSYECPSVLDIWVHAKRLGELRKRIKDVDSITIAIVDDDDIRLEFSGNLKFAVGGEGQFNFNLFGTHVSQEATTVSYAYKWHATTAAQCFQTNIDFICDDNDAVMFNISGNSITLAGVTDAGRFGEKTSQIIATSQAVEFECMFYKKLLKVVTMMHSIDKSLVISFSADEEGDTWPVLFSSSFDQGSPGLTSRKSHFSVYIAPLRKPDN